MSQPERCPTCRSGDPAKRLYPYGNDVTMANMPCRNDVFHLTWADKIDAFHDAPASERKLTMTDPERCGTCESPFPWHRWKTNYKICPNDAFHDTPASEPTPTSHSMHVGNPGGPLPDYMEPTPSKDVLDEFPIVEPMKGDEPLVDGNEATSPGPDNRDE